MYDANLLLLNRTNMDSGNDGTGSGSDEAATAGRVVDVAEGSDVCILLTLGEADSTVANTSETFDLKAEISRDGGSTWGVAQTWRQITASELKSSGNSIDESAGDVTFKRAVLTNVGIAESGNDGIVKMRLVSVASSSNHWAPTVAIVNREMVREEWLDNAFVS